MTYIGNNRLTEVGVCRSVHRTFLNGVEAPPRSTPTVQILHPALHPRLGWSTRNFWTRNTPPRSTPSLQILHPVLHPGPGWSTRNFRNRTTAVLNSFTTFSTSIFLPAGKKIHPPHQDSSPQDLDSMDCPSPMYPIFSPAAQKIRLPHPEDLPNISLFLFVCGAKKTLRRS